MGVACSRRKSIRYLWLSLVLVTAVACAALVYISLLFGYDYSELRKFKDITNSPEKLSEEKCIPVCDSKECIYQSNFLLKSMESTANPCENYFDFACGKFVQRYNRNESRTFIFHLYLQMQLDLKNLLEDTKADNESAIGKVKTMYDSCIKPSSSEFEAVSTAQKYLASFGIPKWPNLKQDFQFSERNLTTILGEFLAFKEYAFISFRKDYARGSIRNGSIVTVKSTYEKKEKPMRKYLLEVVLKYFKFEPETINTIYNETEAIQDAITHLKEESEKIYDDDDSEPISISCGLDTETKWLHACEVLDSFINTIEANKIVNKEHVKVDYSLIHYVENFMYVLRNFSDRSVANYLALNLMINHLEHLNFYFRLAFLKDPDSYDKLLGIPKELNQRQHCVDWLMRKMFVPLTSEYIKKVLTMPVFYEFSDLMQENIREAADAMLHQEWMTEAGRKMIAQRTSNIVPDLLLAAEILTDEQIINTMHNQFHPTDSCFLKNVLEYSRFQNKAEITQFNLPDFFFPYFDYESLLMPGAGGGGGTLFIQLGITLPPLFRAHLKRPINLVTISSIIAHEIGHNIYETFLYDSDQLHPSENEYMSNTLSCLENQYSQFKFELLGKNMNGSKYLRENIADSVAISIIDKFIKRYTIGDDTFLLPGFSYTMKQMLYLSSLEIWCESTSQRDEEYNKNIDIHSLGKFRMIGMMQNSQGFAKAFNCPEGSYMNPTNKCLFPK